MSFLYEKRRTLIIFCVVLELLIVPLAINWWINLGNKAKNNTGNDMSSVNEIGKQEFGIMYRDSDTDSYKEYNGSIIDAINNSYVLNLTNSKCIDEDNKTVSANTVLTINGSMVSLKSNKTMYCTLYFDLKKLEITNANKVCDLGTSMSVEFTTSDPATEYYYSTNGEDFTKSSENIYSLQGIKDGSTQKIYAYAKSSDGTQSATKEFSFTTQSIGSTITASQIKASNPKDLTAPTIQGDMYRYQAAPASADEAAQMTNWIMFGEECTNDYAKLSEADKIDKYMYRIIGITDDGEMKLIKETFLKEGTVTGFAWNDEARIDSGADLCPDGICPEWNEADLFQRINGTANGTKSGKGDNDDGVDNDTDIFVDSERYSYLRSGDNKNGGTSASTWYNLITEHEWMYGDTVTGYSDAATYNGDNVYQIETGQKETTHYVGLYGSVKSETYTWPSTNKVKAKISLMYIHDYVYAYPGGNPGNYSTAKNAWIFFQKDGYNTAQSYEWLSTRWGVTSASGTYVNARYVNSGGGVSYGHLYSGIGVRPVFYLSSEAKIVDGAEGTKSNPYKVINN